MQYVESMFDLQPHGPDTFVGHGPQYPWGGLYGGQIVAQALRAASITVESTHVAHSIRAYFIRPGDHAEPVRYDVERIRNGRSFVTRRVVARQANGAILNAECSFQKPESSAALQSIRCPDVPAPDTADNTSFTAHFDRRFVDPAAVKGPIRDGVGRVVAWMRVTDHLPIDRDVTDPVVHQCWLAYVSDDLASDTVRAARATVDGRADDELGTPISLDHTVWFHRPMSADRWHVYDYSCHHFTGSRGLAIGHVFDDQGVHVATIAQEVLLREPR